MRIGIVGCSINGAYLAWKLSEKHEVTVFERKARIGDKPCSGLVSERVWKFIPRVEGIVKNKIDHAMLHFPSRDVKMKFHPRMLVLDRDLLDRHVSDLARDAGAKILLGSEVKRIFLVKGSKPQVQADKMYEFDYLIGCDGFNSIVRKSIGSKEPRYKLGIYTYAKRGSRKNFVDVYPSKSGFGWAIPRGTNAEYGFLEKMENAKRGFDVFCKARRVKPGRIYSHVIPEGLVRAGKDRVALCGDAVGLTKPTSSGGIIWGLIACDILLRDFPNLNKYDRDVKRFFEPKIFYSKAASFIGRTFGNYANFLTPKEIWFDSDILF